MGGTGGSGGRGGVTGTAGTAGTAATAGTTGTAGGGGRGGTGIIGANCVENVKLMGYAYPPAMPCSACFEASTSLETKCRTMIDCLDANYPCTGNCYTMCLNTAGGTGPLSSCVTGLVDAACAGGPNSCPLGGVLDCSSAGALELTPGGQVTDFSAAEWNATTSKFCDAHGLDGSVYQYAGTGSTSTVAVDTNARNLRFDLTVTASQYAGGGLMFDSCVDASAFNAVQFTAALTAGSLTGCGLQVGLSTQDQRPATATNPSGGTCTSTCYQYPYQAITTSLSATPVTITALFSAFNNPTASTTPARAQIAGLAWQANSSGGTGTCTAELRIDDIKFVTQ
jgi:hypothetical protein